MMPRRKLLCLSMLAACSLCFVTDSAFGQKVAKPKPAEKRFVVFHLKHALAKEAADVLGNVFGEPDVRIVADPRTNSLFLQMSPEALDRVSEIIKFLDVPPPDENKELKIFQLRTLDAKDAAQTIEKFIDVRISVDQNALIVRGLRKDVKVVEALLLKLDGNAKPRPAGALKVRVVWLVTGSLGLPKPPADLTQVSEEFAKLGITGLQMAGQLIVNVSSAVDRQFSVQGTIGFETPHEFSAEGVLKRLENKNVDLEIAITAQAQDGESPLSRLNTMISAPIGHAVALGATPIDGNRLGSDGKPVTSVFVVQVLDK